MTAGGGDSQQPLRFRPYRGHVTTRHAQRLSAAGILWSVALANAAVMVYLWLHAGGVTAVHHSADLWTSIGRITGLLGAYGAVIQVLLLARLPVLERLVGFDRLTVWHRRNGKATMLLILAHVGFITVGYQQTDQIRLGKEISSLLSDYPHIVAATIGTGLLIAVVVSSLVIVRRRLPYEAWYAVHLLAYAGIVLGYLHQIPTGNELTTDHAAQRYWHVLYLVALGLLLVFRVAAPIARAIWFRLRVERVTRESADVVSVDIGGRHLDRLRARSGQFFMWRFLDRGRWWQAHPFSLSRAPDGRSLRITVKGVGGYSRGIGDLRPGTRVFAEGPFGTFTGGRLRHDRVALIAGGIGITPIRSLLEDLPGGPGDVALIYRALDDGDVVLRSEIDALAHARGAAVHYVVGDHNGDGAQLLSPEHLCELIPDIATRDVYVCGPPAMADALRRSLRAAAVPRRNVHTERFAL
jgi:predicted ferric reductase